VRCPCVQRVEGERLQRVVGDAVHV
jgi:hypothetical protein